ncbi:uncharacterized protein [Choristoneura fumiferana]|uniref:uncharacterized protein n=1 Tax=Choristoneura fumiferana TaxID=7141 RepID=UPI003D159CF1
MCARVPVLRVFVLSGIATWCLALQDAFPTRAPGNTGLRIIPGHTHPYPYPGYYEDDPGPPDPLYPVLHAGLPRELAAEPRPLPASDHELMFNVSWLPSSGPPARDYSLEVHSDTDTVDCRMTMCYEYNIPGSATWWSIPAHASPVTETCAVRPGCAYRVRLVAHPWDGHTAATLRTQLAGVRQRAVKQI